MRDTVIFFVFSVPSYEALLNLNDVTGARMDRKPGAGEIQSIFSNKGDNYGNRTPAGDNDIFHLDRQSQVSLIDCMVAIKKKILAMKVVSGLK